MFYTKLTTMLAEAPGWIVRSAFDRQTITLLRHRTALGDTLMLTPLVRGLKQTHPDWRVAVATRRPDIFWGNPNVDEARGWHLWRTRRTARANYNSKDMASLKHVVEVQWQMLWQELQEAGVPGAETAPQLHSVHPELMLSEEERARGRETLLAATPTNRHGQPVVLTTSGGKLIPTHNREWGIENYQALVNALAPHATILQVGGDAVLVHGDKPLPNLGALPAREVAALFAAADAVLLQEGGLHHLARAVEAPAVVLYGGSILPEQTGYDQQLNLVNRTDCSPCLSARKNCSHLKCMTVFTPRLVAEVLAQKIAERGKKLHEDAIASASDHWTQPDFIGPNPSASKLLGSGRATQKGPGQ